MTNKNKNRQFKEISNFCTQMVKDRKFTFIIMSVVLIIALLTGIIVAARTHSSFKGFEHFGLVDIKTGSLMTTFFSRFFSMLFIALILFGCSYTIYLFPLALIFLAYRTYLLGLNFVLLLIYYGVSGIIVGVVVVLPCQLCVLAILALFYIFMSKTQKDFKCFGGCTIPKQKTKIIVCTLVLLLALCLVENILAALFSAKVILVI